MSIVLIWISCSTSVKNNQTGKKISVYDGLNPCDLLTDIENDSSLNLIALNAKQLLNNINTEAREDCLLDVVSSLSEKSSNVLALAALDSIGVYSDGFLSEFLSSIVLRKSLVESSHLAEYLYATPTSSLNQYFVYGLIQEASSLSEEERKAYFRKILENQLSKNDKMEDHFNRLISKI